LRDSSSEAEPSAASGGNAAVAQMARGGMAQVHVQGDQRGHNKQGSMPSLLRHQHRCTYRRGGRAGQQPGLDTAVAARARHMPPWRSCRSAARPRPRRRTPASLQSPAAALPPLLRSRPLSDGSFGWGALHYQLFYSIYFFQEHLFTSTTHHMCFFSFACNERQLDGSVARAQRLCNQQGVNYSLIRVLLTRCYSCYT
jgi:hypothetical protein